jgi:hypothetical protein
MNIVILGLSITSSWGNGHATTYRALVRALAARGHQVLFLERDTPWYAENRDLVRPPYCRVGVYHDLDDLTRMHGGDIADAELVIVGSYVPQGIDVADTVLRLAHGCTAFYDIDTPVTLAALESDRSAYLSSRRSTVSSVASARSGRAPSTAPSIPTATIRTPRRRPTWTSDTSAPTATIASLLWTSSWFGRRVRGAAVGSSSLARSIRRRSTCRRTWSASAICPRQRTALSTIGCASPSTSRGAT